MSLRFCPLSKFVGWSHDYDHVVWKWGRLGMGHTYVVIFGPGDVSYRKAFDKVKDQVNIVKEIGPCWNTVHPGTLRNTIVIFEKKEALPNESGSQV